MSDILIVAGPPSARRPADHDGVPMCSHLVCPKFDGKRCIETGNEPDSVCIPAVKDMALALACHDDASTPAFDEIAKLCGCPTWEYPGQVVRDVSSVVTERDALLLRQAELLATIVRVTNETPFPDEVKGWEAQRAAMIAEVGTLRAEVAEYKQHVREAAEDRDAYREAIAILSALATPG